MTKREKELHKLRNQIARLEASREAAIKTLVKAEVQLPKLGNRLRRLTARDRKLMEQEVAMGYITIRQAVEENVIKQSAPEDDDDLPEFLDRTGRDKDEEARAEIEAEQEADKKRKAERRIAKLKISQETKHAELTGQRRKMPLTGKEALAAIRAGE